MKFWRSLMGSIALSCAVFMTLSCSDATAEAENAALAFMEKFLAGDSKSAMTYVNISEDDARSAETAAGMLGMLCTAAKQESAKRGGIDEIESVEAQLLRNDETQAVVKIKVTFVNGSVKVDALKLIQDGAGQWKVVL